jgi:dipeptidyl aminopeptidase/acylaminoacyl peptidase
MAELKEVFEMVTKQTEPDLDSWKQQEDRHRRAARNRKVGALALVAAIVVALGVFALVRAPNNEAPPLVSDSSSSAPSPVGALAPSEQDVEIVDLDGNALGRVSGLPEEAYGLSLSTDGSTIAFVTADGRAQTQIATIGTDGAGMRVLTTEGIEASMPAWSPDGTMIAFEGVDAGIVSDIYVMNADGSDVRQLTDDPAYDQYPQWSPDGFTIAYDNSGDRTESDPQYSSTTDIWTVPVTGGTPTRLTTTAGPDAHPSYSPDGNRIAYFRQDGIWVMDADGAHPHRILKVAGFTPRWSPDGTAIAFTTYDDSYRPFVNFGGTDLDAPLVIVNVLDVGSGRHHTVGDVGMATDLNTPQWVTDSTLLIRRVGH